MCLCVLSCLFILFESNFLFRLFGILFLDSFHFAWSNCREKAVGELTTLLHCIFRKHTRAFYPRASSHSCFFVRTNSIKNLLHGFQFNFETIFISVEKLCVCVCLQCGKFTSTIICNIVSISKLSTKLKWTISLFEINKEHTNVDTKENNFFSPSSTLLNYTHPKYMDVAVFFIRTVCFVGRKP